MENTVAIGYNKGIHANPFILLRMRAAGSALFFYGGFTMLFRSKLFRRDIEPRCAYCLHANPLDDHQMTCRKRGIVQADSHCRSFRYDPIRRVPPKPAVLRGHFTDADFFLEEND